MKTLAIATVLSVVVFGLGVYVGRPTPKPPKPWQKTIQFCIADHYSTLDTTGKVVMLGNSITAGGRWHEIFGSANVLNRGIGGDTTSTLQMRLEKLFGRPKAVFLMIGVNDLSAGKSVQEVIGVYRSVATELVSKCDRLILQSVIHVQPDYEHVSNSDVAALNELILELATELQVEFVDLNLSMAPEGALAAEYSDDGLHLNGKGYAAWANVIGPIVTEELANL